jgi:hypothetical protein
MHEINLCVNGIDSRTHVYESLTDTFFIQDVVKEGYTVVLRYTSLIHSRWTYSKQDVYQTNFSHKKEREND